MPYKFDRADVVMRKFQPRARASSRKLTEIGKAEITPALFGRNKVYIVNPRLKARRTILWFLLAVSAFVWLGQNQIQRSEAQRHAASQSLPSAETITVAPPEIPASNPAASSISNPVPALTPHAVSMHNKMLPNPVAVQSSPVAASPAKDKPLAADSQPSPAPSPMPTTNSAQKPATP